MSVDFSQIKSVLSKQTGASLHRHIVIFAGDESWQQDAIQKILAKHKDDSLWIGEDAPQGFPSVSNKKAKSWLGQEKQVVIFDANTQFDADAFAAITGIVIGGGLFILLMPATEQWGTIYSSHFGQRLVKSINTTPEIIIVQKGDSQVKLSQAEIKKSSSLHVAAPFFTLEQQHVVNIIEEQVVNKNPLPVVINSDRGRGKSAALGIAIAELINNGIKSIAITAPRLRATEIIFKHIEILLPDAEISRGTVKYKNSIVQFYSPDQLIVENIKTDILFIDEAAAIPVPILTLFIDKYPQCIFASTVHGYEGTGRGFALRFNKILNESKPGWKKCLMKTPVRWAENDPLEKWMFTLLCLDAEIPASNLIGNIDISKIEINPITQEQLVDDKTLLNEVFALLVLAHYRTQPSDLQRLMDDEQVSLYIVKYNEHVLSVALVNHEGQFSPDLSSDVYRGNRRPAGHLLAQALTYHCGVEHAATLKYARIMRIAVHPEFQQQGIGSKLLDFMVNNEKQSGCDAIGTSFGMNNPLLNFWRRAGFNVVRIGFKREQTSGEHAAIMLMPLSEQGKLVYQEAYKRFTGQVSFWFEDILRDISAEIKKSFEIEDDSTIALNPLDKDDLQSFIHYSRNYELCIAALNKFVRSKQAEIAQTNFPAKYRQVLNQKVNDKASWKEIVVKLGLHGQAEARELFYKAIVYLLD